MFVDIGKVNNNKTEKKYIDIGAVTSEADYREQLFKQENEPTIKTSPLDNITQIGRDYFKNQQQQEQLRTQIPSVYYNEEYVKQKNNPELFADEYAREATKGDGYENLSFSELENLYNEETKKYEGGETDTGYNYGYKGNVVTRALDFIGNQEKYKAEENLRNKYENLKRAYENRKAAYTDYMTSQKYGTESADEAISKLKEQKKSASDEEKKKIDDEIKNIRSGLYGESNVLDYAVNAIKSGANTAAYQTAALFDVTLGNISKALGFEDNVFSQTRKDWENRMNKSTEEYQKSGAYLGDENAVAGQLLQGATAALPDAIMAIATGGASTASTLGVSSTGLVSSMRASISTMAKNPFYWTSFGKELGSDYYEALDKGASEGEAMSYALIAATLNAVVEVGGTTGAGGIQTLPEALRNAKGSKSAIWEWVKSAFDEGKEEAVQGVISGLTEKIIYDQSKEVFSLENEDAIINPQRMASEFALGAAVGGILGGGQMTFNNIVNASTSSDYKKIGKFVKNNYDVQGIIDYGKTSIDANIRAMAQTATPKNISDTTAGELYAYVARDINSAINSPESIEVVNQNYSDIINKTNSELISGTASSQYIQRLMDMGIDSQYAETMMNNTIPEQPEVQTVQQEETQIEEPAGVQTDIISLTEDNRQRKHLNKATQDRVKEIANTFGVNVIFENVESKTGVAADSYYDNQGNIHMDFSVTDPVNVLVKHELTHFGERGDTYKSFVNMVKNSNIFTEWLNSKIKENVSNKEQVYRNRILENYKNAGVENISYSDTQDEMIANFAADMLFTDNGSGMDTLVQMAKEADRPAIIRWILNFIRAVKNLFKGKFKTSELNKLEKKYVEMLKQAESVKVEQKEEKQFSIPENVKKDRKIENLKNDVENLKELLKLQKHKTHGKVLSKKSIENTARKIMREYGVKGDVEQFTSLLSDVYNHIAKGEEVSWDSIKDISQEAINWLKNNQEVKAYIPEESKQVLNYLKSEKIKLNDIQKSEIIYRYGSLSNFRKQFGYYIKISENGIYLDNLWASFVSDNPGYFETDIVSAEQPLYLADLVDTLRNTKQYDDMYSLEGYDNEILSKIYDYYWDIATETTVADKYSQRLNELKAKHKEEMDAYKEKTKNERKNYKQKMEENLKKSRQEIRNKLKEKQQIRKLKEQIKKSVNKLQTKLLKPTKNKNVPLSLQKAVASALSIIDTSNTNKIITNLENKILKATDQTVKNALQEQLNKQLNKKIDIDKIKAAYDSIKNSDDPDLQFAYAPEVTNYIEAIAEEIKDIPFKDLSLQQLEDVKDMFDLINARITQENQFADVSYKMTLSKASSDVQNEISETGEKTELISKVGDVKSKFLWNNRTPIYAMRTIGSDVLVDFYNKLRKGEDVSISDIEQATQFNKQKKKAYGYYSWDFKKSYTFTDANGKKFNLNLATIMSLYAYSKREQALKHLFVGGFQFSNSITVKKKNKVGLPIEYQLNDTTSYRLDKDILDDIVSTLTTNQKSYVEEMQKYLSETMGDKGNEVTKNLYGIKLFKENYYFPIKTAKQQLFELNQKVNGSSIFERSFTKEVSPTAKNPIILGEFNSVWASHVKQMSDYHGLAIPLNDFQKLYNYFTDTDKSVKASIQAAYGDAATQYIQQLIQDINGGTRQDYTAGVAKKFISLFKKSAVFASLSVAVQQRSALIRSWAIINPKYFVSKKIVPAGFIKTWNTEMKKYAPICIIKEMGRFDTNVGTRTEDYINGRDYDYAKDKFKAFFGDQKYRDDLIGALPQMADMSAWFQIWEAVKKETSDITKLEYGTEKFYERCGERFTDIVTRTQVYDSVFSRSAFMRSSDGVSQLLTSFLSEPTLSLNIMEDAIIQTQRGKANKSYAVRALSTTVLSMIAAAIMKSFITAGRDDDEDKTYAEKYIGDVIGNTLDSINPFAGMPYFRDIVSIFQGYDVERSDMSLFSDLKQAIDGLSSESKTASENFIDISGAVAAFFGLPVKNVTRDIQTAINIYKDFFVNESETDKTGIIYSILEELNINTSYEDKYQDLINYSEKGKTDKFDDVMDYLEEKGKDYSDIKSGIKAVFKKDDDVQDEADEYISEISSNKTYQSFTSEDKEKLQTEILDTIAEQKALDVIETEADRFDKLYQYYRTNKIQYEKLKKEMLDEGLTESAISSNMEIAKIAYMKSIGIDVSEYLLFKIAISKQYADKDNSGGVSKSEKIQAINKMDLSAKEKSALISSLN